MPPSPYTSVGVAFTSAGHGPSDPLPDHHIAEAPRRKLTSGSCCARVSSALRVVRPAVVSVVAVRASGTLRVRITTSRRRAPASDPPGWSQMRHRARIRVSLFRLEGRDARLDRPVRGDGRSTLSAGRAIIFVHSCTGRAAARAMVQPTTTNGAVVFSREPTDS